MNKEKLGFFNRLKISKASLFVVFVIFAFVIVPLFGETVQAQTAIDMSASATPTPSATPDPDACGADSTGSKVRLSNNLGGQDYICYDKCKLSGSQNDPGCSNISQNPIMQYLVIVINVLSAGVGIVVTGMIIFRGIQYSLAKENPQATSAAKDGIRNAIIALLFYMFGYALLNYLIPGGLLG